MKYVLYDSYKNEMASFKPEELPEVTCDASISMDEIVNTWITVINTAGDSFQGERLLMEREV